MGKNKRRREDISDEEDFFHDPRQDRKQKRRNRRKSKQTVDNAFISAQHGDFVDFEQMEYDNDYDD